MEQAVELSQVLAARERRVWRQNALLEQYRQPLLSFTMNIAGPVKNSPEIRRGFHLGESLLLGQLEREGARLLHAEQIDEITGCEGLYVVALSPARLWTSRRARSWAACLTWTCSRPRAKSSSAGSPGAA